MTRLLYVVLGYLLSANLLNAHPTGNMIVVGENLIWVYIDPIDDQQHHACIMMWRPGSTPEIILKSEFEASDYILSSIEETVYIIERKFNSSINRHQFRVLKMHLGNNPIEIWKWRDDFHVGEGGFVMLSDEEMIYAEYPGIYSITREGQATSYFDFPYNIKNIESVDNDRLLLLGEDRCWLTNKDGDVIKQWDHLRSEEVDQPPLHLNLIFDIDYRDGKLLIANWGNRSLELIDSDGMRKEIRKVEPPYAPHWVCFYNNEWVLFSSQILLDDGRSPLPQLVKINDKNQVATIWEVN